MIERDGAGAGAFEVHERVTATRLRRLKAEGATNAELIAALDAGDTSWRYGADGEVEVGRVLDEWAHACGFATLHDLTAPGERANIDHVVVGPCGVAVIDAKAWTGALSITEKGLRIRGWNKRREVEKVLAQVARVDELLRERGLVLPVRGYLCMANRNAGLPETSVVKYESLGIGTPEAVVRAVAQGNACSRVEAETAVATLTESFKARAVKPVEDLLVGPPARAIPPPPVPRRRARPRRRGKNEESVTSILVRLALVLALVFGLFKALDGNSANHALSVMEAQRMVPALRAKARKVADGPVHGPARTVTPTNISFRFRRGRCRVVLTVDRHGSQTAADARIVKGRRCPSG